MTLYHTAQIFTPQGDFFSDEIESHIVKGRKNFLLYLPRETTKGSIEKCAKYLSSKKINICIHDLTYLHEENDVIIGRNLQKILTLIEKGVRVESLSYHFGSLYGYGRDVVDAVTSDHLRLDVKPQLENKRFFCSVFDRSIYKESIDTRLEYLFNIAEFARQNNLKLLIKNLSLDYTYVGKQYADVFSRMGYNGFYPHEEGDLGIIALLVEKGEFPRSAKEMLLIVEMLNIEISLDLEHLLFQSLMSNFFNAENETFLKEWNIQLNKSDEKMLYKYGFTVKIGAPLIYEKPVDIVDEILSLKDKIFIAHISGSVAPVFLDKEGITKEDLDTASLIGILPKDKRRYARLGREQIPVYGGITESTFTEEKEEEASEDEYIIRQNCDKLFKNEDSVRCWNEMFVEIYTLQIASLKKIGVKRVVQKVKGYNEHANATFQMFSTLASKMLRAQK